MHNQVLLDRKHCVRLQVLIIVRVYLIYERMEFVVRNLFLSAFHPSVMQHWAHHEMDMRRPHRMAIK